MGLRTRIRRFLMEKGVNVPGFLIREHDRVFHEALAKVRPGMVMLDIGAHRGETAAAFAARGAMVFAFEPNPDIYPELEKRALRTPRIFTENVGVLDRSGTLPLYLSEEYSTDPALYSESSSFLSEKPNVSASNAVQVPVRDILDVIDSIGSKIDILKLDVEGAEYRILTKLVKNDAISKVDRIYVETHHDRIPELGTEFEALRALIEEGGIEEKFRFDWARSCSHLFSCETSETHTQDVKVTGPTVAIATGILGKGTETGVRRHIQYLFGGRTVVLTERIEPGFEQDRPTFLQLDDFGPMSALERITGKAVSSTRYQCSGVPFGRARHALEAFLKDNQVAAILCEFGHIGGNLAPIARSAGLPIFVYFRGFDASKRLEKPRIVRRYKAMAPRVDGFVSVSQFLLDNLARHGVTNPNSHVLPTGVDTDLFRPGDKDPNLILAVGRIVAKKAPMVMLEAFARVAAEFPHHRLEVIGDGEMRPAAEERMRALDLSNRVNFLGLRNHEDVRNRMSLAPIFLQHSVTDSEGNTEGLPTSIQEAMASGAAVVSTRHAGIPEAVTDGVTGLLVGEHDVEGFSEALRTLLANPDRAARLADSARSFAVDNLDYRSLHTNLETIIREACIAHGVAAPG